jgi:opacity protein-like surface antigen
MKPLLVLISTLIYSISLQAQSDYGPGYILKPNGDTVKGSIFRGTEQDMAEKIKFKADNSNSVQNFSISDINGFGLDNDIFRKISFQNTTTGDAVTDSSFAKLLVSGFYELYTFERNDRRYYIVKNSAQSYLLYTNSYTQQGEVEIQGNYVSRLQILEGECKEMTTRTDGLGYDQQTMSKFVSELDECLSPGKTQNLYHKAESKMEILAWVGGLPLGAKSQVVAAAWLRFSAPRLNRYTFLNLGMQYSRNVKTVSYLNGGNLPITSTEVTETYSVPINIQYNFTTTKLRPYIYGGFSVILNSSYSVDGVKDDDSGLQKSFGFTFMAGAGIEYRPIAGLIIKADYQYELYSHFPAIGIGYQFK